MLRLNLLFTLCLFLSTLISISSGVAVMSVDLGTEWMKIGIVSPGVPMEIVLNKESKRKTPAIISFRDGHRDFGEDAQVVGIRFPKNAYGYLLDLLGKDINNPMVKLFRERFPYYDLVENPVRKTVSFRHDDSTIYTVEELIAQILQKAKEYAEKSAGQQINECVLTVPGFFNQIERKAFLQAAQLANLKVLQLINDYTAVALNYGIFRSKDFNDTANYVMFYDMGASKTTATIVSYQNVKTKERGFVETHPQLTVLGVGYDRMLGGLEVQLRLRDYLASKFNELKLTPNDATKNARAMAKLFKEAGRLKNVLSANTEHYAQVENLLDEKDFRVQVTRENLQEICKDLFARVGNPVKQALEMAGLSMDVIGQVILVGAGTRVPKIQEELQKVVKIDLSKNINTDEAATMGAVYKAADLSAGFKVKKFITKDAVLFPIQVVFERKSEDGVVKQVRRTLFNLMNPYPQKKIITFNKNTEDFQFRVNYAELDHLSSTEVSSIGGLNLTEINLVGVDDAIKKNEGPNIDSKGIKAHFFMDESGILQLVNVDYVVEKTVSAEEEVEEEGTLSKLGSTISKLFQSASDAVADDKKPEEEPTKETENIPKEEEKQENKTAQNETITKQNTTKTENKPKVVVLKEPIQVTDKILTINQMTAEEIVASQEKLENLNKIEKEKVKRETALNNLESFVVDTQNKLYLDEYIVASEPEELEKIKTACSETSDWLYEDGSEADAATYDKKLSELHKLTRNLFIRVYEHNERPEALKALKSMLNGSQVFLENAKNFTKGSSDKEVFTEVEIQTLEKIITETTEWRNKMVDEQKKIKKYEPVKLTIQMLSEKMALLDREVKYLVNKLKIWKPKISKEKANDTKPVKEENSEEPVKSENNETKEESEKIIEKPETLETNETVTDENPDDEHSEL